MKKKSPSNRKLKNKIKFITGNKGKFKEVSLALSPIPVEQTFIELEELQDMDRVKILKRKIGEALKHHKKNFLIEDTCVYFGGLGKRLPGPFIKWFINALKPSGLYELSRKLKNNKAEMVSTIAYAKNSGKIYFFEGKTKGTIVKPKGQYGFGLDPIFKPLGNKKTLAELKSGGDTKFSQRHKAAIKLKKFLLSNETR